MNINMVVISSAIHTSSNPLSYSATRSVFTHQQRFEQSVGTVNSVREHIPNAFIVFIEGTKLDPEYKQILSGIVNYLYEAYENDTVRERVGGPFKGLGEVATMLSYFESPHFRMMRSSGSLHSISKISGRYSINRDFRFEMPNDQSILATIKYNNKDHHSHVWMSTMFFTVPQAQFDNFIEALKRTYNHPELNNGVALEHIFPNCIKSIGVDIQNKSPFHVGGEYGPWGGYVEH